MPSRFSSVVNECEVCTAFTTTSPCDTCNLYGNQETENCHFCGTTLHAGFGKFFLLKRLDLSDRVVPERYVWVCKVARACMGRV